MNINMLPGVVSRTDNLRERLVSERRYLWDRADQIIRRMYTDGAPSTPAEKYRQSLWGYDATGRMTVRHDTQRGVTQRFSYDDEHRISRVEID
ncbi:hypothetical protein ABIC80_004851, partial [Kosakonia sp. 1610]